MARDLPLGNGSVLVNFDRSYQMRDFYFPRVGNENHTSGHPFRFGVWVDGIFRWIDDPGWQRDIGYETETLVSQVTLAHPDLPLLLVCNDVVDFHEDLYLRRVGVVNKSGGPAETRFFFHHDFHIYENDVGDTAYYEPQRKAIFHYKDLRWFLINGARGPDDVGVDQFATGQKEVNGLQGTWRDAEDGVLSGNPIAQGSVDSTIALHLALPAGGAGELYYWIAVAQRFDDAAAIHRRVLELSPERVLERNRHYWRLWVHGNANELGDLPPDVCNLFVRSLLIVRTQIDEGGAILAANDFDVTRFNSDTYSYVWPRDGALVARALIDAGMPAPARDFLSFCGRLVTREGFLLHKYNPDGSLASSWHPWFADNERQLPIQEDETGLLLWALWHFFERYPEVEFIKPFYRDVIVRAADFLAAYHDAGPGLPSPSWDLWEERRGVHAWTVAAVHAGLLAASHFADAFGESELCERYRSAAAAMRAGADCLLWQESAGRFVRMLTPNPDGTYAVDWTIDSSVAGLFLFGMYEADDPRIVKTMESVRECLWVKTSVGGVARYENDTYYQTSRDPATCPGNPWFVCTMWVARWLIARAQKLEDLAPARELLQWASRHALPSGVLAEQIQPFTGEPLSVSPLTWSHAEVVQTVVDYLDKLSNLNLCPACGQPLFLRERQRVRALRFLDAPGSRDGSNTS